MAVRKVKRALTTVKKARKATSLKRRAARVAKGAAAGVGLAGAGYVGGYVAGGRKPRKAMKKETRAMLKSHHIVAGAVKSKHLKGRDAGTIITTRRRKKKATRRNKKRGGGYL